MTDQRGPRRSVRAQGKGDFEMRVMVLKMSAAVAIMALGAFGAAAATELPDRPLDLEGCVALALEYNPSLTMAAQGVRASAAGLRRSASAYYPSALFLGTRGRTGGTSFLDTPTGSISFSTSTERSEAEVRLNQVVWEVGRKESVRSARHSLGASRAREQAAITDLVLAIAQRYYGALAAEQLVEVQQANLTAAGDHEKLVRARVAVGETAPVDVAPAEADVAGAEFALLQSKNNADLAKAQLKMEMGVPPTYRLRLAQPEKEGNGLTIPTLEECLALAREERPELAAMREDVAAGEESVRLAKLRQWGSLALWAEYDIGIAGPMRGTETWAAVVSVAGVLFDDGSRQADVEAARAGVESLKAQEQQLINSIGKLRARCSESRRPERAWRRRRRRWRARRCSWRWLRASTARASASSWRYWMRRRRWHAPAATACGPSSTIRRRWSA